MVWRHCESINNISGFKRVCNFYEQRSNNTFLKNDGILYFISLPSVTVMILDLKKCNLGSSCVMWPTIKSDQLHLLPMLRRYGTVVLYIYFFVCLRGIHNENLTSKIYLIFGQQYSHIEGLQFLVVLILVINHS